MIRALLISSVLPENTTAGNVILYRHLVQNAEINCESYGDQIVRTTFASVLRNAFGRLPRQSRLRASAFSLLGGHWIGHTLSRIQTRDSAAVVITVAHGDLFSVARRFAARNGLPLVSIYHDWWPDLVGAHSPVNKLVESRFHRLYRESDVALCVSGNMKAALGPHRDSRVLYPIPSAKPCFLPQTDAGKDRGGDPFKLFYFGNLGDYGASVQLAMKECMNDPEITLQLRGRPKGWSTDFTALLKRKGLLHDFAPVEQFEQWLQNADAILITASFDGKLKRRMKTSFPSKLVEATRFGKPLIIWAPAWSSAAEWGLQGDRAVVVTSEDFQALLKALKELRNSPRSIEKYANTSRQAFLQEFNPAKLQDEFRSALRCALKKNT